MTSIKLRPVVPDMDFAQLATWFTLIEDEPSTETSLKEYYQKAQERVTAQVAMDQSGVLVGFYWIVRHKFEPGLYDFSLFVSPEWRGQGIGRRLYEEMKALPELVHATKLRLSVRDDAPADRSFAERRGFIELMHQFMMGLDLQAFDDRPYDAIITRLEEEGFQFTSMAALGNTEEVQRKLYALNEATGMDIMGSSGEPSWESFADFQSSVCQADWYMPGGQMVVIDTLSGGWAAMSAITRFAGADYAYNLHTGVDRHYRGRKLGQAVKVCALRYARQVLGVKQVRTHHNTNNLPMIAIDQKLGYVPLPGTYLMEKNLEEAK